MALRIGQITYSNCAPIFFTLKERHNSPEYTFIQGIPAELNKFISNGEIDISPSSSIEYAINPKEYLILPELSISSIGRVESILLFSKLPIEGLNNKTIALTKASATSTVLLKILLKRLYNHSNIFVDTKMSLKGGLKRYPAYLLIGDDALREAASCKLSMKTKNQNSKHRTPNSELYIYDLGKMWHKLTGKPFVFALWIVRRDAAISKKGLVTRFYKDLLLSKNEAYINLKKIARDIKYYNKIDSERLIKYWKTISYDLGRKHIEGLLEFYKYAEKTSVIKRAPELNFFDPAAA
ncbi:MAG: menaquinone biosynthesis protein [Nitrospirae bacterium]|nr:menaquinone biosynthesis protein [Nitrospirota bacterium]